MRRRRDHRKTITAVPTHVAAAATTNTFHPGNVELQARLQGTPLATFKARAAAFAIDLVCLGLIALGPHAWSGFTAKRSGEALQVSFEMSLEEGSFLGLLAIVVYFGLSTYFGRGATLGKRLLGIRVVSLVHERLTLWHSIERALGYAASSLEAGFGFLQYYTHPNRQTVHDRIAETIVVVARKRRTGGQP